MKAILVIDMPKNCCECPIKWDDTDDAECCSFIGTLYDRKHTYEKQRVKGCPLKPIPQKKDINIAEKKGTYYEIYTKNYVSGWNDCLDEILGEEE